MAMQRRSSGVWIDARGAAAVAPAAPSIRRARLGELRPPPPAGMRRAAAAAQAPISEEEAVVNALEAQDLDLVDAIPVTLAPAASAPSARRGAAAAAPAELELTVPASEDESAVVLIDQGGVYSWQFPEERATAPAADAAPSGGRRGPRAAAAAAPAQSLVFRIRATAPPAGAPAAARRGGLLTKILGSEAVVYVFRFAAKPLIAGGVRFLERNVVERLLRIGGPDPEQWEYMPEDWAPELPRDRVPRVLLLVHGTFSSTIGSFGHLAGQPAGREFLQHALRYYDLVIGYDHATLSRLPSENAGDLLRRLQRIRSGDRVVLDAVSYSRGGLVLRSLLGQLPASSPLRLRRAVFVGCTLAGTELANPANWHRLADRYTNLAAAGARAAALMPGFASTAVILASAIRGVGGLVKVLASTVLTEQGVPGLAAMEPEGEFLRELALLRPQVTEGPPSLQFAVTSNFDPDQAQADPHPDVLPPGLLMKLGDKAADALYGKPNDLVVHLDSMTEIEPLAQVFSFGTSGTVHHCAYFSQPETAGKLLEWLGPEPMAAAKASRPVPKMAASAPEPELMRGAEEMDVPREELDEVESAPARPARRGGVKAKPPAAAGGGAAAPAGQVECHFRAETDDQYELERVHTVQVTISREQLAAAVGAVHADAAAKVNAARLLVVECIPKLRVVLAYPDDARVEIPVPAAGDPAVLRFDLKGSEAGPAEVQVQVRQGPLPLATLRLKLEVVAQRARAAKPVQAEAELDALPRELPEAVDELRIVQVQPAGQKTQYRYELCLPSQGVRKPFESPLLDSDPATYVAALHKRIENRWAQYEGEKRAFARDLRAIGSEMFDQLFPRELREQLWQHRATIRSVQVISSEPFIPWELVLLRDPKDEVPGPDAAFLGELGVVRWLLEGYPPQKLQVRKDRIRYLVPDYPPPDTLQGAQEEVELLKKRGGTAVPPQAEAFFELLRNGAFDLLHVASHGTTDANDIGSARLLIPGKRRSDGSASEEDILATSVRYEARLAADGARPIVVLNACQSARGGFALKGLGGFAEAFVARGAGVFVGSSWSVGDQPAYAFVRELYRQLLDEGKTLADASAAARRKARDDGDATWLAYVVYGHPRAVVTRAG